MVPVTFEKYAMIFAIETIDSLVKSVLDCAFKIQNAYNAMARYHLTRFISCI